MLKIDGSLARNIIFEVANLEVPKKTRRKTSVLKLQGVKLVEVSHEMFVLMLPRISSPVSGFPLASPLSMEEAAKPLLFEDFQAGCHVVLRGTRGTL